jgi:Skp family chaperone for outer membrane proteins
MRLVSSICAAAIVAAAFAATPDASAQRNRNNNQATTVVVVDYTRIIAESAMGRDMTAKLQQVSTQVNAEAQALAPERQSIDAEAQRLTQATRSMNADQIRNSSTYAPQVEALQTRVQQFEARGTALQGAMDCTQAIAIRDFDRVVSPIVRNVMESRGAGVAIDVRNIRNSLPAFDITNAVIQQLDQSEATRTSNVTRRQVSECQASAAGQ